MEIIDLAKYRAAAGKLDGPVLLTFYGHPYYLVGTEKLTQDVVPIRCSTAEEAQALLDLVIQRGYLEILGQTPARLMPWPCAAVHIESAETAA